MKNIELLAAITFKEGVRNKVMYGILFFAVSLCFVNLFITSFFVRDMGKISVDVGLSTISLCGLAIIFFMGMNLLAKDMDKLTVYMVLSRPISRAQYIVGKFLGICSLIAVSVVILAVLTALSVKVTIISHPDYIPPLFSWWKFAAAASFSLLSLLVITALSFFFTCLTSSSFMAVVFTAGSYVIGQNVELVRQMLMQESSGSGSLLGLIRIISWVFPNLAAFDFKTVAAYGLDLPLKEIFWTGLYGVSYSCIVLFLTILVFKRRELT